ncbi:MAG: hypothetical protein ACTSUY_10000 [Alphaproteobacteria bacterium]
MKLTLICSALVLAGLVGLKPVAAQQATPASNSDYAAQANTRTIKTLSAKQIEDLRKGRGSGFAKAAEFNGLPGPVHLLALQSQIGLEPAQVKTIEALLAQMKAEAIPLGILLIDLEKRLNQGFARAIMTTQRLKILLEKIAKTRAALRYVHLSTHFASAKVVTPQQGAHYAQLRGYGAAASPAHSQHKQ